ncbi:hypothetical protein [Lysobacter sp. Hz 25]|uniref:hypothetical protein n=1 Tax=Lysobacter sp. Hz 25 TaxID=3383698 RepID=UPI0038D4F489
MRTPAAVWVRSGGAWHKRAMYVRIGGTWQLAWTPTVPITVSGSGNSNGNLFRTEPAPGSATVTAGNYTVTGSGGNSALSYSWVRISGDAINISSTTAQTVSWSASVSKGSTLSATFRCTVSDTSGQSAFIDVGVSLDYYTDL